MNKIFNYKCAFFCIYAVCSLILISGVDLSYADGTSWETNIKRSSDPTTIDMVSAVSDIYLMDQWPYPQDDDVTTREYSIWQRFGIPTSGDIHDLRLIQGVAFRAEDTIAMTSGETKEYIIMTQADDYETFLQVQFDASDTFKYELMLEPSGVTGTELSVRSKNTHYQFIGGRDPETIMYEDPTYTSSGPTIRTKYYGTWGIPFLSSWTILSPNQTLMFKITNLGTGTNYFNATFHLEEVKNGVIE